jgi:predicted lactoylglutathione lyase
VPVPQRISLLTLGVADVARATAFFESLGWRRSSASVESTTFFNTAGPILTLFGREDLADDAGVSPEGSGFRAVSVAINLESREAVDAAFAEWVAAGATPVKQPVAMVWGGYSSYVADLDGHLWELAHNPHFEFDVSGVVRAPA